MSSASRHGEVRIGTSGWHYKHWIGTFYPPKTPASKMLSYYCQHFDTVELNNTFYRLPVRTGLENWRASTPKNFIFAAKGSRFLTHMKKLKDPEPGLAKYFERVEVLEDKLGPILFQLPPGWQADAERFENFIDALPAGHRYAFEFRNPTWDTQEIYSILRRKDIGYCIFQHLKYTLLYTSVFQPCSKTGSWRPIKSWRNSIRRLAKAILSYAVTLSVTRVVSF